jgi:hypothetical protein
MNRTETTRRIQNKVNPVKQTETDNGIQPVLSEQDLPHQEQHGI